MYEHVQKIPIAMILYVYTYILNKCTRTCRKNCHETNMYMYVFIKYESVRLAMNYTGYMYWKKKAKIGVLCTHTCCGLALALP